MLKIFSFWYTIYKYTSMIVAWKFLQKHTSRKCHYFFCRNVRWYGNKHRQIDGFYAPHWFVEFVFFAGVVSTIAAFSFVASVAVRNANADDAATSATIGNTLPVASATSIDSAAASITLTENTTTAVVCTATVTDNNGCADITTGSAVLYRTDVAGGSGCTPDDNDCYTTTCTVDGGSCTGGADLTSLYTCNISAQYFADPTDVGAVHAATDWSCTVTPTDSVGNGTTDTDTIEMDTLTALNVTATIAHGSLALNSDTGATNQTTTIINTGNESLDAQISGTAMTCDVLGSLAATQQKYDVSDVTYASLTYTLDGTPTTRTLTLPQRTSTEVSTPVYWGLAIPASGVSGSCTGTNTFTAIAG